METDGVSLNQALQKNEVRRRVSGKHSQRTRVEYWIQESLHKAEEGNTIAGCPIIRGGECLDVRPSHPPHPFTDHLVFLVNFPRFFSDPISISPNYSVLVISIVRDMRCWSW
jgi:hypothetical protein